VVSVDPSSAFTRGALLGDRVRLSEHFTDPGVFIRSMGTRGHVGGLAEATLQAIALVDAAGTDVILVETVGAGQTEIEIVKAVDLVVLTLMPGSGDAVQALKAGIMEIPDVIALTKSDQPGAAAALADIRAVVGLDPDVARRPLVLATSAVTGDGVAELWEAVVARRERLLESGGLEARRSRSAGSEVVALATARFRHRLEASIREDEGMRTLVEAVERRELDPVTAADELLRRSAAGRSDGQADAR
jgi:LAO/AO transport system kinase